MYVSDVRDKLAAENASRKTFFFLAFFRKQDKLVDGKCPLLSISDYFKVPKFLVNLSITFPSLEVGRELRNEVHNIGVNFVLISRLASRVGRRITANIDADSFKKSLILCIFKYFKLFVNCSLSKLIQTGAFWAMFLVWQ